MIKRTTKWDLCKMWQGVLEKSLSRYVAVKDGESDGYSGSGLSPQRAAA